MGTVVRTIGVLGWTCKACRGEAIREMKKLRDDIKALASARSTANQTTGSSAQSEPQLTTSQGNFQNRSTTSRVPQPPTPPVTRHQASSIESTVIGMIRDTERRKDNVVISGLPEDSGKNELSWTNDLVVNHLRCPAPVNVISCSRLGHTGKTTRPRKLLVRLSTEAEAKSVLNYAKTLRISTDSFISANIFINPDLTVAESKLAYEKRLARRNRDQQGATSCRAVGWNNIVLSSNVSVNQPLLRHSATPFVPTSAIPTPANSLPVHSHSLSKSFQPIQSLIQPIPPPFNSISYPPLVYSSPLIPAPPPMVPLPNHPHLSVY